MTSDTLEDVRSMGRRLGLDLIRNIAPASPSHSLRRATVVRINLTSGGYTADLNMGGGTLHAIPITVDCLGCGPGDRVLVETYGTQSFVTGVLARPGQPKTIQWKVPYSNDKIHITRIGGMCIAGGTVKYTSGTEFNDIKMDETLPLGFRPSYDNATIALSGARATVVFFGKKDGSIYGRGNTGGGAYTNLTGCWPTADPYPS